MLFAADLFNEGLDLPDVDTVLFLRPTESSTIFLQQLGRGLRRTSGKPVLTVLDFVGHHRKEFRFDIKLRALTGQTRKGLEREIERGFAFLPSGCQIVMDKQAQTIVLENLRSQIANRWRQMVAELRSYGDHSLAGFLDESGLELSDVLRRGTHSWTRLRRDAGLSTRSGSSHEEQLLRRVRAFAHVDDPLRASTYRQLLGDAAAPYADLSAVEQRVARMLFFSLWPGGGGHGSYDEGLSALRAERATREELDSVVDLAFDEARHRTVDLEGPLAGVPLRVHASYQREEVLAALDYASLDRKPNSFREGVLYVPEANVDALLRDAVEVGGGLLPHDHVPGLSAEPHALPLGVPVGHLGGVADRAAVPERHQHGAVVRAPVEERRVRYRAVPLPRTRRLRRAHR